LDFRIFFCIKGLKSGKIYNPLSLGKNIRGGYKNKRNNQQYFTDDGDQLTKSTIEIITVWRFKIHPAVSAVHNNFTREGYILKDRTKSEPINNRDIIFMINII
jgi:hypothetical protein